MSVAFGLCWKRRAYAIAAKVPITPACDLETVCRRAFALYGPLALWNLRPLDTPTAADALAITRALRTHGRMDGRRLAEDSESLCRAAH